MRPSKLKGDVIWVIIVAWIDMLLTSFIMSSFDFTSWGIGVRIVVVLLFLMASGIGLAIRHDLN
jgi:hypothetical protein